MPAFYNEIDPFAASWLEGLIDDGRIAAGVVNRATILDLQVRDVSAAIQAHFFAGIGGWSYALRLAGWPDDCPVWTGSCPCQPFSTAGRRRGKADERHLWPALSDLIRKCRPPVVLGEQVASSDGLDWLDVVLSDLERAGYAVGAADLCAAGVGAPHLRQRLYFVALADGQRLERVRLQLREWRSRPGEFQVDGRGASGVVADAERGWGGEVGSGEEGDRPEEQPDRLGQAGILGDAFRDGGWRDAGSLPGAQGGFSERDRGESDLLEPPGASGLLGDAGGQGPQVGPWQTDGRGIVWFDRPTPAETGACRGSWSGARWHVCRDGKGGVVLRPAQPGLHPLAHGVPGRVGLIRGAGNSIVSEVAKVFIETVIEYICETGARR